MLTAKGDPIQHEVTSTDKNGKEGRIILDIDGANLLRKRPAAIGATTISVMLRIMPTRSMCNRRPSSNSVSSGVTTTAAAVDRAVMTILRGANAGSARNVA